MYNIELITIGEIKKGTIRDLADMYLKHLKPFVKISYTPLKAVAFRNQSQTKNVLTEEANTIQTKLKPNNFKILLTEHGTEFASEQFATKLAIWSENGARHVQIIIGGPLGIDKSLSKNVDQTLSLSRMTFPHDIAHILLLEQLYRAFTIQTKKTYHY